MISRIQKFNQYIREQVNCDKDAVRIINKSFLWLQRCLGRKMDGKKGFQQFKKILVIERIDRSGSSLS